MNFATVLVTRMSAPPGRPVEDPLDAALARLAERRDDGEHRLFKRICRDLAAERGHFRREEIDCLSDTDQALLYALALARLDGRYPVGQWERLR